MSEHIYKCLELTGSSTKSSDEAIRTAIERASDTVRGIKWFEVTEQRGHVEGGKVSHWQVSLKVWFAIER